MQQKTINKIFEILATKNPSPTTELVYTNGYTLLVAVVLSAQTTDVNVNKATKALFQQIHTPEEMVRLGEEKLKEYIKSIGLFNAKSKNIILLSKKLIELHHSQVPNNLEDLTSLPGVGSKTARVILNTLFKQPYIAVDTHVFRVSKRIGLATSNVVTGVETELEKTIPTKWILDAHHWLILHGRYTCKAKKPACKICTISEYCQFYKQDSHL
ncbi:MAG: endonuclease III [Rickettsiales bacterium]|nr:endonuclease III [Rickettsiales bacterium]